MYNPVIRPVYRQEVGLRILLSLRLQVYLFVVNTVQVVGSAILFMQRVERIKPNGVVIIRYVTILTPYINIVLALCGLRVLSLLYLT